MQFFANGPAGSASDASPSRAAASTNGFEE